jgi:hypothetical protein
MSWLVGLGLVAAPGGVIVFGALTGRLASILAAFVKPADLGTPGTQYTGGAETPEQGETFATLNQLDALAKQAQAWGLTTNPAWKAKYDATVKPLVIKATQTDKQSDLDAAISAYQALNNEYNPGGKTSGVAPPGTPQTPKTIGGKNKDPYAGQPPEVAPPPKS